MWFRVRGSGVIVTVKLSGAAESLAPGEPEAAGA
jgi:hypothetical protein